jgi:hypothetical protein
MNHLAGKQAKNSRILQTLLRGPICPECLKSKKDPQQKLRVFIW